MVQKFLVIFFIILAAMRLPAQTGNSDETSAPKIQTENQSRYQINSNETFLYEKPQPFQFLLNAPGDIYNYTKHTLKPGNWKNLLGMTILTAMMVHIDQDITDITQQKIAEQKLIDSEAGT